LCIGKTIQDYKDAKELKEDEELKVMENPLPNIKILFNIISAHAPIDSPICEDLIMLAHRNLDDCKF
jgi:hypothetical protein